ncbi:hypothetical protein [Arthrobacter sp. H5]|uniref:hypothetical protein n=1 Tax=Arthrobacter sp. H5 TaxID=1267973 RepID=UPI0004BC46EB|nr:hypothetical protein [Arthrobacter sp. H5]
MDMSLLLGAMFTGNHRTAKGLGLFVHLVMMSALVFGSLYALVLTVLNVSPGNAWWAGAIVGLVHGLIAGLVMPMMPLVHPRMSRSGRAENTPADPDSVELQAPGLFAKNYGGATPAGLVMAHIIFGLVTALVYALIAA